MISKVVVCSTAMPSTTSVVASVPVAVAVDAVVSLTKPQPSFLSRHRHLGRGAMSKCFSPDPDNPSFYWTMVFVIVSRFNFYAMPRASGCGGASATLMYPSNPFSRSHLRRAVEMVIVIVSDDGS